MSSIIDQGHSAVTSYELFTNGGGSSNIFPLTSISVDSLTTTHKFENLEPH